MVEEASLAGPVVTFALPAQELEFDPGLGIRSHTLHMAASLKKSAKFSEKYSEKVTTLE